MARFQETEQAASELQKAFSKMIADATEFASALVNLDKTLKATATSLDGLKTKTNANKDATDKLTKAQKAEAEILRLATAEGKKEIDAQVKLTQARKLAREEAQKNQGVIKKSGGLFKSFTKSILTAGAAFFGAGAIISGVKFLVKDLFNLSKQMQGESVRAAVVFGDQLKTVEEAATVLAAKMGVTNREFVSMAAATADLLIPLNFTRKQAADMSVELQSLTGALDEWTAGSVGAKGISEILTKAMLGENEQLKRLGIAIRKDTDEFRDLVKIKLQDKDVTKVQAEALATLELIQRKSVDAQTAYNKEGNKLLRLQKSIGVALRNAKENFINLFNEEKKQPDLYRLENKELTLLFGSLKNTNLSQDARNKLITTINDKYGQYLPNLLTEKSTLDDIEKAETSINKQLRLKVIQQAFQEEINDLLKAELKAKEQLVDNEINRDQLAQKRVITSNVNAAAEVKNQEMNLNIMEGLTKSTLENNSTQIASTEEKFKRIGELYGIAFSEIEAALNEEITATENTNTEIVNKDKNKYKQLLDNAKAFSEDVKKEADVSSQRTLNIISSFTDELEAEIDAQVESEYKSVTDNIDNMTEAEIAGYEDRIEALKEFNAKKKELASEVESAITTIITDQFNANVNNQLNTFTEGEEAKQEVLKNQLDKGIITEAEYEKKLKESKLKVRIEEAKAEKNKALFEIAIATAVAAVKALPALPLVALVLALGAVQAAVVAAKPLPKYKQGTKGKVTSDHVGIIGDGGASELLSLPDGKSYLSPAKDTPVFLPRGSEVFSGADTKEILQNGGYEVNNGLVVKELQLTRKAIEGQPKYITTLSNKGLEVAFESKGIKQTYINKYLR